MEDKVRTFQSKGAKSQAEIKNEKPKLKYEKPQLDLSTLELAAKAFAVKSGMSSC